MLTNRIKMEITDLPSEIVDALPMDIIEGILEYAQETDDIEWEAVCGSTRIYRTNHVLTYGGGPEGGYVYFYKEREAGWYRWERDWGTPPTYTRIDGVLAQKFEDDIEYVAVVPNDFQYDGEEDISILDDYIMQEGDDD